MVAFYELSRAFDQPEFSKYYNDVRKTLIEKFIFDGQDKGFWQEAPESWGKRMLNIPYLQVQASLLGYYLLINNNDMQMKELFDKLISKLDSYFDHQTYMLNVVESNCFDGKNNQVPMVAPSVLWYGYLFAGRFGDLVIKDKMRTLQKGYFNYRNNVIKDRNITLFTESFFRFGVIRILEDKVNSK